MDDLRDEFRTEVEVRTLNKTVYEFALNKMSDSERNVLQGLQGANNVCFVLSVRFSRKAESRWLKIVLDLTGILNAKTEKTKKTKNGNMST